MRAKVARRFTDFTRIPANLSAGVVAIGNFDGVHRGHQAVLAQALETAEQAGTKASVLTFEPHPRTLFRPEQPVFRLTPAPMRARILGLMGFAAVYEQAFDKNFAALDAETFIETVLRRDLDAVHVVTGFNFHFGKNRQGDAAFLADAGRRHGFGVTRVGAFEGEAGKTISSSRIRELLSGGDVVAAAGLLGYRFSLQAEVMHGQKLGRTLGYPTANMALPPQTTLQPGIYAVRLRRADGTLFDGVASFGRRPTVADADAPLLLETFVFDAAPDLYGETCTVSFFGYLRGEEKFDDLEALKSQMKTDEAEARALLAGVTPISPLDRQLTF
ncbi:bifunctional riboflavin kinase/FAD synthetase [Pseudohoeflea sp. DP4N28-3]|uniref:Riboflavin biosynthesis protein n=1 Tax=Pseudohoeflea coraliihabitans TaxID=2860393 RepID=A0ABS6WMA5_9HYPH|nr:bifunctional riboflavin kinase/FAD synthetase [Pseudohoeflea sp. DP4N28-3]